MIPLNTNFQHSVAYTPPRHFQGPFLPSGWKCGTECPRKERFYVNHTSLSDDTGTVPVLAYTISQVSIAINRSQTSLREDIRKGDLTVVYIGASVRILPEDLREFLMRRRTADGKPRSARGPKRRTNDY